MFWNGQLVVYAHGYVAPHEEVALPAGELGRFPGVIELLLSQGYAFATTSYSKNGYAVAQAEKDLNALVRYFKTKRLPNASLLEKVLIVGASEGGLITTMMVEKYPGIYDGGLAMCGPLGGLPAHIQYLGDFRVAFDYYFEDVFDFGFGMADVPDDAYLGWDSGYWPLAISTVVAQGLLSGATQQLFSVTGAPYDLYDPSPFPTSYVSTTLQVLYYNIVGTPDMIATAGGIPYDNQDTTYIDPLLNEGVERVDSDGRARAYVRRAYQPDGKLKHPLVTLHNEFDPAVPYWHEEDYEALAAPSGMLTQIRVPGYGHCEFTPQQVLSAFYVLAPPTPGP
jgi:pimeloyl-ACP methyl ester carboxylesterase